MVEGIGNHVGDGLALTGSRRAIEDEATAFARLHDSLHLRRVYVDRHGKLARFLGLVNDADVIISISLLLVISLSSFRVALGRTLSGAFGCPQQTLYDSRPFHLLGIVVNVVPHHELIEREQSEHTLLHNVPTGVAGQLGTHGGKDGTHVVAMFVFWQRLQTF